MARPTLLLHYILTVLVCCRVRACRSCIVVSIHARLFLHEMVRARVRRVSEVQAGRSPSRVRPVRAGAAVQCTCKAVPRCCCSLPVPGRSGSLCPLHHCTHGTQLVVDPLNHGPAASARPKADGSCISRARLMYIHSSGEMLCHVPAFKGEMLCFLRAW